MDADEKMESIGKWNEDHWISIL